MNNLKRVLSLGLVGAMLSGMMIMGAGAADYTDVEDIENIEAVEAMGSLNIINGKDDGRFDPEGLVTRAEMAKMIAVAMNGGIEPNFGTKATPAFTDIKGHWAETFIEYCADVKIIGGRGDGTFDPSGNVTGVEAAKMVLSALGYDADAYMLTGANWDTNVNYEATQTCKPSLYDGVVGVNMNQAINRDTAAQIIWNGLQNIVLVKTPDKVVSTGEVTYNYQPGNETLLEARYDATIGYGILANNSKTKSGLTDGHIELTGAYRETRTNGAITGTTAMGTGTVNFPWDMDLSNIGEEVKVIFKDGKLGRSGQPDKNDVIYGVFNTHKTEVVTATRNDIGTVKTANKYVLKIDGTEYDTKYVDSDNKTHTSVNVIYNYGASSKAYTGSELTGNGTDSSALSLALAANNGDTVKAVFNDYGAIDTIYVTNSKLSVVTAVSADKVTLSNVGTIKKADNEVYEDVAKDDVVVVTTLYNSAATNENAYSIVEKAEVVTGELTKIKNNTGLTVDGTEYKVYHANNLNGNTNSFGSLLNANIDNVVTNPAANNSELIGKEVELYLVNGFVGAIARVSKDANNYSVITDIRYNGTVGSVFDDLKLQVMNAEGEKTIITVSDDSHPWDSDAKKPATTGTVSYASYDKGDIVTYDVNKDGTATVTIRAKNAAASNVKYDKDTKSVSIGNTEKYVTAANCVLFVDNELAETTDVGSRKVNFKAYQIRNLGNITTSDNYAMYRDSDGKVVAIAIKTATPPGAGSSKVYGMVTSFNGTVRLDGTPYRQYTINVNGDEYVVNQKNSSWNGADPVKNQLAKGRIVCFEPTSDGYYEGTDDFTVIIDGNKDATSSTETAKAVYVKEYVEADGIITVFLGKTSETVNNTTVYTGTGSFTYAVDDDVKMYFVDTDNDTAMASGSVGVFNTMTGFKSAFLIVDNNGKVTAIIAEVSGEADVTAQ